MISSKKIFEKFGANVVRLARINLGAKKSVDGKKRVTNNSGDLSKSLDFNVIQKRDKSGRFATGYDVEITSDLIYAPFIEEGVQGSVSTPKGAEKSPFKFKGKNIPTDVVLDWIKTKPVRLRDTASGSFKKATPKGLEGLAFVIGRKIATEGITPRHYVKDAFDMAIANHGSDLSVAMAEEMIFEIFKQK